MPDTVDPQPPVTLEQLRRCLTEELDIALDEPGRPATPEPSRASRDPERWAALATYGHPGLEPALRHRLGPDGDLVGPGDETLVLRELDGRFIAFRSDRTPPLRVRTLGELSDLGAPTAGGEAAERAGLLLEEEVARLRAAVNELQAARRDRWERMIRQRFRELVSRAVRAEQSLRQRQEGEAPDAHLVWLNLTQDELSGWHHASSAPGRTNFPAHLALEVDDFLPRGGPGADDRPERELVKVRSETGRLLVDLIREFGEVMYPKANP